MTCKSKGFDEKFADRYKDFINFVKENNIKVVKNGKEIN